MIGRRKGFTLIELLVVIAIIAILAALLFASFITAKAASQTAKCLSHEKQLYGALMMYTQDYSGMLPGACFLTYGYNSSGRMIGLYVPYVRNTEILACQKNGSYGYSINLTAPVDFNSYAWVPGTVASRVQVHKEKGHNGPLPRAGRPLSDIPRPSRMMGFMCGLPDGSGANGWEWEPHDIGYGYASRMANRHNGGTTYAFMDGHVKCLKPTGIKYEFPVATLGIDYDGDGSVGDVDFMR